MRRVLLSTLLIVLGTAAHAAAELPIFDAHVHYSRPDWDVYSPERALSILAAAGVRRAIVSSTPDDGTLKLYEKAPKTVVPFLRPYRTREDMGKWHSDPGVQAYVEERLKRGVYRGIGEFHLSLAETGGPTVKRVAELASERDLFLQAHVDDATIEKLLSLYPNARFLWAHAGMSAPASAVGRLLERFPKLYVELALRTDVAPSGTLDPEWRAVFVKYPDRFMVGTDTWVTSRWGIMRDYHRDVQTWLAQLPREVAEAIAWKNGERLFPTPAGP
jgi:predicted TIM-barrel fold metal-dependent hydrolase